MTLLALHVHRDGGGGARGGDSAGLRGARVLLADKELPRQNLRRIHLAMYCAVRKLGVSDKMLARQSIADKKQFLFTGGRQRFRSQ